MLLAHLLFTSLVFAANCAKSCIRKEINDYTDSEWISFANAFNYLSYRDTNDQCKLESIMRDHNRYSGHAHGSAEFLPWHRQSLLSFEALLQTIDPYWDSASESNDITSSRIWKKLGTPRGNTCVTDGLFNNLNYRFNPGFGPDSKNGTRRDSANATSDFCLSRSWDPAKNQIYLYSTAVLNNVLKAANNNYTLFETSLEISHGSVHINNAFVLLGMVAPVDPLFWIHHAFYDKIWSEYQVDFAAANMTQYSGISPFKAPALPSDIMQPFATTVQSVLNISELCYSYAPKSVGRIIVPVIPTVISTTASSTITSSTAVSSTAVSSTIPSTSTSTSTSTTTSTTTSMSVPFVPSTTSTTFIALSATSMVPSASPFTSTVSLLTPASVSATSSSSSLLFTPSVLIATSISQSSPSSSIPIAVSSIQTTLTSQESLMPLLNLAPDPSLTAILPETLQTLSTPTDDESLLENPLNENTPFTEPELTPHPNPSTPPQNLNSPPQSSDRDNWFKMNFHLSDTDPIPDHVQQAMNNFKKATVAEKTTKTRAVSYAATYTPVRFISSGTEIIKSWLLTLFLFVVPFLGVI